MVSVNLESRLKLFQIARESILTFNENNQERKEKEKGNILSFECTFFLKACVW